MAACEDVIGFVCRVGSSVQRRQLCSANWVVLSALLVAALRGECAVCYIMPFIFEYVTYYSLECLPYNCAVWPSSADSIDWNNREKREIMQDKNHDLASNIARQIGRVYCNEYKRGSSVSNCGVSTLVNLFV